MQVSKGRGAERCGESSAGLGCFCEKFKFRRVALLRGSDWLMSRWRRK